MPRENSSFLKNVSRFILVISAFALGLRLWTKGLIDPERLAVFMVLVVIAAAIDSVWVKLILALATFVFFLLDYTNYEMDQFRILAVYVGAALMALLGIFIIIRGISGK